MSYENVSLIFCFLKYCADMSRRNTSQRPLEVTNDRLRLGRVQHSTSRAQREKQAVLPPLAGRGRGRLGARETTTHHALSGHMLVPRMDHGRQR